MEPSRRLFYVFVSIVGILTIIVVILFGYLFFTQPQIIPQSETFESFWIKNLTILIGALSLAGWGIAAYQNSIEQRRLRYLENYPYLQVVPFLSVDIIPLPVPKAELPSELIDFNVRYLSFVAPSQDYEESDIDFRYLGLALRNVGHGRITRFTLKGVAEVPDSTFSPIEFEIVRGFHLEPEQLLLRQKSFDT